LTVEIYRVLSQDEDILGAKSILHYFNSVELMPLTISQILLLFEVVDDHNYQS
jgi:hypothetical protein